MIRITLDWLESKLAPSATGKLVFGTIWIAFGIGMFVWWTNLQPEFALQKIVPAIVMLIFGIGYGSYWNVRGIRHLVMGSEGSE